GRRGGNGRGGGGQEEEEDRKGEGNTDTDAEARGPRQQQAVPQPSSSRGERAAVRGQVRELAKHDEEDRRNEDLAVDRVPCERPGAERGGSPERRTEAREHGAAGECPERADDDPHL